MNTQTPATAEIEK